MGTSRCIYVNCFNRLRFLAVVSTKLHKIALFWIIKDHNSERKHRNRQMTPSFSSTFSTLTIFYQKCNQIYIEWTFFRFPYSVTSLILSNKATYFHKVAKPLSLIQISVCEGFPNLG